MLTVRVVDGQDKARVDAFYTSEGRSATVSASDFVVVAESDRHVVGVVRLCAEEGHCVLRTMWVREDLRGQGVGTRMLRAFERLLEGRECFCVPFDHLTAFYGQIGFERASTSDAPQHLRERLEDYLRRGERVLIMHRPGQREM